MTSLPALDQAVRDVRQQNHEGVALFVLACEGIPITLAAGARVISTLTAIRARYRKIVEEMG